MITELMVHLCSHQMKNASAGNPSEVEGNYLQYLQEKNKLYIDFKIIVLVLVLFQNFSKGWVSPTSSLYLNHLSRSWFKLLSSLHKLQTLSQPSIHPSKNLFTLQEHFTVCQIPFICHLIYVSSSYFWCPFLGWRDVIHPGSIYLMGLVCQLTAWPELEGHLVLLLAQRARLCVCICWQHWMQHQHGGPKFSC